ncbi:WhiB family transcriptional regulator [Streptomyces sp. NPDC048270]|uniref:WhiB family transcriptional regulator n=1 Tax=Streptomyces sp. NPDC048270 TaxID=3154615 RepID=UPI0033EB6754
MGVVTGDDEWSERALCRAAGPEELFVDGAAQNKAKAICTGCPVRTECLAHALDHGIEHGIWGGTTERERRAPPGRRQLVTSWRRLLEAARSEHDRLARSDEGPAWDATG